MLSAVPDMKDIPAAASGVKNRFFEQSGLLSFSVLTRYIDIIQVKLQAVLRKDLSNDRRRQIHIADDDHFPAGLLSALQYFYHRAARPEEPLLFIDLLRKKSVPLFVGKACSLLHLIIYFIYRRLIQTLLSLFSQRYVLIRKGPESGIVISDDPCDQCVEKIEGDDLMLFHGF